MAKRKTKTPDAEWFIGRANYLASKNEDRNKKYDKIDNMVNMRWDMPDQLDRDWIFKQVTTFFAQAITAAVRILADIKPKITITPAGDLTQATVDGWERALRWFLHSASRRRPATIIKDIAESAVRYSEVAMQVIFVPEQIKSVEAAGGNAQRYKAIQRRGPFIVRAYHPSQVHARFSDAGPEEVAVIAKMDPHDIVDLWGEKANEIKEWVQENEGQEDLSLVYYDYTSYDWRFVMAAEGEARADDYIPTGKMFILVEPTKWKWPFLPWVLRYQGTTMEDRSDDQRRTLLDDAVKSEAFETMNRVKTLRYSEMIRYAGAPKKFFQSDKRTTPGITGEGADLTLHIEEEEAIGDMQPPLPDPGMAQLDSELRVDAMRSTLSEILFGGDIPAGTAYSTINLVTHSALNVLKDSRQLSQDSVSDLSELFLLWAHYTQTDLSGYGMDKEDRGVEYLIYWKDIDPDNLYIDTDLSADLPTDRQSRILAANQAITSGLMSKLTARDEMGLVDGKMEEKRIVKENLFETLYGVELENLRYRNSQEFMDQIKAEVAMEIQAALAQQGGAGGGGEAPPPDQGMGGDVAGGLPAPPGPGQGGGAATPDTMIPPGAGGPGGPPFSEFQPDATRELQTGQTRGDEELAEV